jgi:hypothetical protein
VEGGIAALVSWPAACAAVGAAVGLAVVEFAVVVRPQAVSITATINTSPKIMAHLILPNIFTLLLFGFFRYFCSGTAQAMPMDN